MKYLFFIGLGILLVGIMTRQYLPRGIRNNNPGNIRRNSIAWQGMQPAQNDDDFVQFISPQFGFRAMTRILRSYNNRGINTVRDIISTYAPSTENHTENYIKFVAEHLNVSPEAPLNVDAVMFELIQAITQFENGSLYAGFYEDSTIQGGIALA